MPFKVRSSEKEYLDNSIIATKDLYQNLRELDVINRLLGGHNASIKGMTSILKTKTGVNTILDIGFGGGDSIKQLILLANKLRANLFFYGVDLKNDCMEYAQDNLNTFHNKKLICDDYRNISPELLKQVDVIHCSLFLHHLTDEEIIDLFKFGKTHKCIILINDLHRHWFAYYSIKFFTALFSKSYLVKNDAPLSVKRGFKKGELIALLQKAGFSNYSVKWVWAFRYVITSYE